MKDHFICVCGGNLLSNVLDGERVFMCDKCYGVQYINKDLRILCGECGYEARLLLKIGVDARYRCQKCGLQFARFEPKVTLSKAAAEKLKLLKLTLETGCHLCCHPGCC